MNNFRINTEHISLIDNIKELLEYSVPKQYLSDAADLLEEYCDDRIILDLL